MNSVQDKSGDEAAAVSSAEEGLREVGTNQLRQVVSEKPTNPCLFNIYTVSPQPPSQRLFADTTTIRPNKVLVHGKLLVNVSLMTRAMEADSISSTKQLSKRRRIMPSFPTARTLMPPTTQQNPIATATKGNHYGNAPLQLKRILIHWRNSPRIYLQSCLFAARITHRSQRGLKQRLCLCLEHNHTQLSCGDYHNLPSGKCTH